MWWQLQKNLTRNTENAFFVFILFDFCASKITAADSWIDGQCSTFRQSQIQQWEDRLVLLLLVFTDTILRVSVTDLTF